MVLYSRFLPFYFEEVFSSTQVRAGLLSVARAQLVGAEGPLVSCSRQEETPLSFLFYHPRGHWTAKSQPICPVEVPCPKLPRVLVARGTPSSAGLPFSLWSKCQIHTEVMWTGDSIPSQVGSSPGSRPSISTMCLVGRTLDNLCQPHPPCSKQILMTKTNPAQHVFMITHNTTNRNSSKTH